MRGPDGDGARALACEVGLGARLDHRADRLSAGERQRVAIARALAAEPKLLLADEPTARLDEANARAVARAARRLAHEHGTAVVCATHDAVVIEQADAQLVLAPAQAARRPRRERRASRAAQIPASARYFSSSHSSIPYFEPSRPMPDSFIPPNGATSVETKPVLIPTIP